MAASKLDAHIDDIILKYRNGSSASKLAKDYGCSVTTMTTRLKKLGLAPQLKRGESDTNSYSDRAEAVRMFKNGVYPMQIIKRLNRSKSWFYELAKRENLDLRGGGFYVPSEQSKILRSKTAQGKLNNHSRAESELYRLLTSAGISVTPQLSIGVHSADFGIDGTNIAVEVCSRGTVNKQLRTGYLGKRVKEFGELGWHVYIFATRDHTDITEDTIQDMLAWFDFIKRQPAIRRQYRMVRSTTELLSAGCCDSNNLSNVSSTVDLVQWR